MLRNGKKDWNIYFMSNTKSETFLICRRSYALQKENHLLSCYRILEITTIPVTNKPSRAQKQHYKTKWLQIARMAYVLVMYHFTIAMALLCTIQDQNLQKKIAELMNTGEKFIMFICHHNFVHLFTTCSFSWTNQFNVDRVCCKCWTVTEEHVLNWNPKQRNETRLAYG